MKKIALLVLLGGWGACTSPRTEQPAAGPEAFVPFLVLNGQRVELKKEATMQMINSSFENKILTTVLEDEVHQYVAESDDLLRVIGSAADSASLVGQSVSFRMMTVPRTEDFFPATDFDEAPWVLAGTLTATVTGHFRDTGVFDGDGRLVTFKVSGELKSRNAEVTTVEDGVLRLKIGRKYFPFENLD